MPRYLLLLVMVLFLAVSAFAQPDPNAPAQPQRPNRQGGMMGGGMNMMPQPAELVMLPQGAFVLRGGVLAKFGAEKLQPAGTLELFGPAPARPQMPENPTQQDRAAMLEWAQQMGERTGPAAVLAQEGLLYIVVGNSFFRVNPDTMTADVKADLAAPGGNPRMRRMMGGAPVLKLEGGVLYAVLGQELLTVDPGTGKVVNRAALPPQMFQGMQGPGGMPGGRPDGANNRPNRDGGGRAGR